MSSGRAFKSELDAVLNDAVKGLEKEYANERGEWGALPNEPCRYCHRTGGVKFRIDDSALGKTQPQVTRCCFCGRDWEADSPLA